MKLELVNRQVIIPESETEPFQCHASTLARLPCGTLVAAWFAGLCEGSKDTAIWLSRYEHNIWTKPQRVAAREGEAHWNPVLFYPSDKLWLFYKVGSDVHVWKTWFITSSDRGFTWSTPAELVNGDILPRGPVKINSCWHQMAPGLRQGRLKMLNVGKHLWIAPVTKENIGISLLCRWNPMALFPGKT
ncbi:putative cytoplasmic protein [Salmonella enterica subsp. arizonae]|uniref:Putative cytoplasmic protein n=1 Tax=Salmonella enterica subsp. arizonae TaxID=59203 RepID=A0A447R5M3_SALER|nr:putative cytoplasmic protein [Salmonella enterica subsp. arizonae]